MAVSVQQRSEIVYHFVLPLLFLFCLGLAIGLTYAPCYSSLCVETYFPTQVRGHVGLFYGLVVGIGLALWVRTRSGVARGFSEWHPAALDLVMRITRKRVSMGGLILTLWIAALSLGSTGYWYPAQHSYWTERGELADWTTYMFRLVWTGVTGHWIDIWLGLVVIPVGRNSLLSRAFHLHYSTLLYAHKLLAYALLVGGLIHGLLYYSFLAAWVDASSVNRIFQQFTPDDPALTWHQSEEKGVYAYFVLPMGALAGLVLIPVIVITSLPVLRRSNYNTFYFVHVTFAIGTMVSVCLHASTNFYFLLPGLLLWVGDWAWRFHNALGTITNVQVEDAGHGWYRIQLPPQKDSRLEGDEKGTVAPLPNQPLIRYHLIVPEISKFQSHPFTVAEHAQSGPVVLFQRGPERKKVNKRDREWTWKLAAMVDNSAASEMLAVKVRIEGPYVEYVPHFRTAQHVLAIVGGTGITGALALANHWLACLATDPTKTLRLVWTVRNLATAQLQEMKRLQIAVQGVTNVDLLVHVSSEAGRIDPDAVIRTFLSAQEGRSGKVWIYASGPAGLLSSVETACTKQKRSLQASDKSSAIAALDWHIASFET